MRKSLFVFVVLTFLASAVPASAQIRWGYVPQNIEGWYYMVQGDRVGMLTADNLQLVRNLNNQYRRARIRSVVSDFGWNEEARMYGVSNPRGFFPMYDSRMKQLPPNMRQRIERGAGIVAAVDGIRRIVIDPRSPWGWAEAAVGAVLVNDSRYRGEPKAPKGGDILMEDEPEQTPAGQQSQASSYPGQQADAEMVYQQAPQVIAPQRAFTEGDLLKTVLAKQSCWARVALVEQLSRYDLTLRDVKDVVRGSVYVNMWQNDLILTAKDGSLDRCLVPPGQERIFILPAGNTGVNALVYLERKGHMLPITGDHMEWVSMGSGTGWIISPKCEGAPCRQ